MKHIRFGLAKKVPFTNYALVTMFSTAMWSSDGNDSVDVVSLKCKKGYFNFTILPLSISVMHNEQ